MYKEKSVLRKLMPYIVAYILLMMCLAIYYSFIANICDKSFINFFGFAGDFLQFGMFALAVISLIIGGEDIKKLISNVSICKDDDLNAVNTVVINPPSSNYTSTYNIGTFAPENTTFIKSPPHDVRGFSYACLYYSKTSSDKDKSIIKILALTNDKDDVGYENHEGHGLYTISNEAINEYIIIPVHGINFIRFEFAKQTNNGTNATFRCNIAKS